MSIATKKGDQGQTSLYTGQRVSKASLRVEAYGEVDELNAFLGMCRAKEPLDEHKLWLYWVQQQNFVLSAELASETDKRLKQRIGPEEVQYLDHRVARLEAIPGLVDGWNIPGDHELACWYDLARTVCRRAERKVIALAQAGGMQNPEILAFLNRLSDLLWLMERKAELAPEQTHNHD